MTQNRFSRADSPRASRTTATPTKPSVLERLAPGEAQAVLHRLLAAHANLRAEAEQIARGLLGEVAFESVADDVEDALRSLDLADGRSGFRLATQGRHAQRQDSAEGLRAGAERDRPSDPGWQAPLVPLPGVFGHFLALQNCASYPSLLLPQK